MALTEGQRLCVETLDRPLVIAAGAGSGKTFTLTKRIVNALESGYLADIGEVCAITFTKKAAGELKSRIKGELRARGMLDQALKVDEAWVSTIHGMCARILRAHAIELGIDPAFSVAEGAAVQRYLDRAVDAVLTEAQEESSRKIDALFAEYPARSGGFGTSVESMLRELVEGASSCADGVDAFVLPGVTADVRTSLEGAIGVLDELLVLAGGEKEGAKRDEWIAAVEKRVEAVREALAQSLELPEALALLSGVKLAKTFGTKEYKARVDEARGAFGAFVMEVRLGAARAHLETLVELARRASDVFAGLKQADGVLDNNDLLVMAARALEEHPSIAERYVDRFKLVMVDEFQDTDQMQVDMIKRLAGPGACRLCTVGDAQQSIYRFRGADVSVYQRHLKAVRAEWGDESIIELDKNFRSHADVLSFVDRVFERPGMFGKDEFMPLGHGREEGAVPSPFDSTRNRVIVQHTTAPWRGVSSEVLRERSARRIAREFASLAEAGRSPGEMVVLLGRMTRADVYAQALRDEGLSCVISGGSVFAQMPEANVVRELAHVVANPHETQSLFNVLTSPLFALTAGDLLEAGGLGGFWRVACGDEPAPETRSPRLACALRVMRDLREGVGEDSVASLIENAVVDSGWLSRLQESGAEGLASAGNVFKAIRMVRDIEREGARGPVSVMRQFDDVLANSKEAPGALSVSGGNSVRIMTIHASKGLEFPVVAIAEVKENSAPSSKLLSATVGSRVFLSLDLGRSVDGDDSVELDAVRDYVLGDVAGESELAAAVVDDAGALHRRLALREFIAAGDEEEAKRLLYVAITRAREALIVSSAGWRTGKNSLGAPKSALAGVFDALDPEGSMPEEGVRQVDFGGSLPAVLECVALKPGDEVEADAGASVDAVRHSGFKVPAARERVERERESFRILRESVFSYSSVAEASHEGDMLGRLADEYSVSVDCAIDGGLEDMPSTPLSSTMLEDDYWNFDVSGAFDADRATDLGTAFHRLAQHSVVSRGQSGRLVIPAQERIEALSRTCNLDAAQVDRLTSALERWFGCDLAREMAELPQLAAEVPFFVSVGDVFLEGEIDLLGFDEAGKRAFVVDYKTGGSAGEGAGDLRCKHVLQAACYAYAILLQGAASVEASFVRVERGRADDASQPQCVRYRFAVENLAELRKSISEAYLRTTR